MDQTDGVGQVRPGWLLAAVIVGCVLFGLWRRMNDGTTRSAKSREIVTSQEIGAEYGEVATLVQFSSAFCTPCRNARSVLSRTADAVPGVVHVEVDAEANLELVRRLNILRTPTTLLLIANGEIANRVVGVPQSQHLLSAIAKIKTN